MRGGEGGHTRAPGARLGGGAVGGPGVGGGVGGHTRPPYTRMRIWPPPNPPLIIPHYTTPQQSTPPPHHPTHPPTVFHTAVYSPPNPHTQCFTPQVQLSLQLWARKAGVVHVHTASGHLLMHNSHMCGLLAQVWK